MTSTIAPVLGWLREGRAWDVAADYNGRARQLADDSWAVITGDGVARGPGGVLPDNVAWKARERFDGFGVDIGEQLRETQRIEGT